MRTGPFRSAFLPSALPSYFHSGWAFFVPYLLSYLLYAWRAWPANSQSGFEVGPLSGNRAGVALIPSLLSVYWVIHAIHLILAIVALVFWWRRPPHGCDPENSLPDRSPREDGFKALYRLVPWILLVAVISIPGVYLEWPSDPWEHLRRITEWQTHASVTGHSAGYKSFYFLAYSLVGWMPPGPLLKCINIYYTAICLCLAWQYYLLGRAVGLDERWAIAFVVVGAVTFGNSSFSYYRYYGLATTIFAQIGAVALTRSFLVWISSRLPASYDSKNTGFLTRCRTPTSWVWISRSITCALLLTLIAASHVQGLGIAALGIAAIVMWRLIEWKRSMVFWILAALGLLNAAVVVWWPRHWMIDATYRQFGWMNAWYGFDILSVGSGAFERTTQIFGIAGLVNMFAGLWLLRRNAIAGWLTIMPAVALILPIVAIPFANKLAEDNSIIVFHRMFLAVPSGLAAIYAVRLWTEREGRSVRRIGLSRGIGQVTGLLALLALTLVPPSGAGYSRLWHLLANVPNDLQAGPIISAAGSNAVRARDSVPLRLVGADSAATILNTVKPKVFPFRLRTTASVPSDVFEHSVELARSAGKPLHRELKAESLTRDPMASVPEAWTTLAGPPLEFSQICDFCCASTALQNQAGASTYAFTADLVPISPHDRYRLEMSIRNLSGDSARNFLAVAWYDEHRRLLISSDPAPHGAGHPSGWANSSYSYFGLVGAPSPHTWTTFRISFGANERATIPPHACFLRVGALLNYDAAHGAVVQLTNVRVWPKRPHEIAADGAFLCREDTIVVAPEHARVVSHASQAAQASAHWPAHQVMLEYAANTELAASARLAGANMTDRENLVFLFRAD